RPRPTLPPHYWKLDMCRASTAPPHFHYRSDWEANVPRELKKHPRWVVWKYVDRLKPNGELKWTKMPIQSRNPYKPASATDPSTWSTFDESRATQQSSSGQVDGIGFVLGRIPDTDVTISGVDVDACIDAQGRIADWAKPYLDSLASYSEVSPSGRGVKVFLVGSWCGGCSYETLTGLGYEGTGQIEIARSDRFFTVTGDLLNHSWTDLAYRPLQLQTLHEQIEWEHRCRKSVLYLDRGDAADSRKPLPRQQLLGLSPLEKFQAQLGAMGIPYTECGE